MNFKVGDRVRILAKMSSFDCEGKTGIVARIDGPYIEVKMDIPVKSNVFDFTLETIIVCEKDGSCSLALISNKSDPDWKSLWDTVAK